jgi:hypothetical protein
VEGERKRLSELLTAAAEETGKYKALADVADDQLKKQVCLTPPRVAKRGDVFYSVWPGGPGGAGVKDDETRDAGESSVQGKG